MKSKEELTGLTSNQFKEHILRGHLISWFNEHKRKDTEAKILELGDDVRLRLKRELLMTWIYTDLDINNAETARIWVKKLLGKRYILQTDNGQINNNTLYIVNIYTCIHAYDELRVKHNDFMINKNAQKKSVTLCVPKTNTLDNYHAIPICQSDANESELINSCHMGNSGLVV